MSTVKWYTYFDVSRRNTYKKLLISHVVHRKKYFSSEIIVCVFLLFSFFVIFHTFYFLCDMFPNEHGKMVYIFWCISTKYIQKTTYFKYFFRCTTWLISSFLYVFRRDTSKYVYHFTVLIREHVEKHKKIKCVKNNKKTKKQQKNTNNNFWRKVFFPMHYVTNK